MTDLVAQLVGALEHCEGVFMSHEINHINGGKIEDDALDIIRAALSAAKDGGWVAVPGAVYEDGGVSLIRRGTEDERCRTRGAVRLYAPLPNPPKEQNT